MCDSGCAAKWIRKYIWSHYWLYSIFFRPALYTLYSGRDSHFWHLSCMTLRILKRRVISDKSADNKNIQTREQIIIWTYDVVHFSWKPLSCKSMFSLIDEDDALVWVGMFYILLSPVLHRRLTLLNPSPLSHHVIYVYEPLLLPDCLNVFILRF